MLRDEVNWSEEAFADSIRATNAALKDLEVSEEQYYARLLFLKPCVNLSGAALYSFLLQDCTATILSSDLQHLVGIPEKQMVVNKQEENLLH